MKFSTVIVSVLGLAVMASGAPTEVVESRDVEVLEARGPTHSGKATYYYQNGNAGSCGNYNSDSAYIVAMPAWLHKSKSCGRKIKVTRGSKSIVATIADTCPSCDGYHIDLSHGAFGALASYSEGEVDVKWHMI